jgi:intracellular sulfur oxidation DsrE/DsrF family protein
LLFSVGFTVRIFEWFETNINIIDNSSWAESITQKVIGGFPIMKNKVILLCSDQFGKGAEELGQTVMETFFTLLKQRDDKPAAIFCMNRGVLTLTDQSLVSVHIQELHNQGVPVYACKTCVDYYGVSNQLLVGEISSMAHFIELAGKHEVLTIT